LAVTGPVTSGTKTVSADTVEQYLLEGQYAGLPFTDPAVARHEQLGQLAAQVFTAIQAPGTSIPHLATALTAAVNGRHLLLWSDDPAIEADWQTIGAGGRLGPDDLLLAVMNQGANKLDPYLHVSTSLQVMRNASDTTVTITANVDNGDPNAAPGYANGGLVYPPGVYVGTVALDFPKRAGNAVVIGRNDLAAAGSDETATVLAVPVRLQRGAQTTVTFRFRLAGIHGQLRVDPSARIPPITWHIQLPGVPTRTFVDDLARTVTW
jgi:hypothetical protein